MSTQLKKAGARGRKKFYKQNFGKFWVPPTPRPIGAPPPNSNPPLTSQIVTPLSSGSMTEHVVELIMRRICSIFRTVLGVL